MGGMSDRIESFIMELLKEEAPDKWLELRRNELASVFGCVPSQINYVISTRFNTDHGYIVESRRGGGGYLRIKRIDSGNENPVYTVIKSVSSSIDYPSAKRHIEGLFRKNAVDEKTAKAILGAVSDTALVIAQPQKDILRANILKNALAALL